MGNCGNRSAASSLEFIVYRALSLFTGTLLVVAPFLSGQEPHNQARPGSPEDTLSERQLIVWTWMQQPQPLPAADKINPSANQRPSRVVYPQEGKQVFTGKIARGGAGIFLKTSNGDAFPLDWQDDARPYEGKDVRISGTLDPSDHSIHIVWIEILS